MSREVAMGYGLLADAVMLLHFGFLVFVTLGGFLAWKWPKAWVVHLVAVVWGALVVNFPVECPLTTAENYFHELAGEAGLPPAGFIDHYIENVIYPEEYTVVLRWLVATVVLFSWAGVVWRLRRQRRDRSAALAR
ncbi:MAG TPA: DUF2784 domain-containing protein [Cryptosporangiaceae bacterium]|nr:DUF2784 domain-containing protein [Cryptosporangiaceae bacterium]